jgi:formate dehydrogenase major subunit
MCRASPGTPRAAGLVERSAKKWVGNDVPDFKADSPPKDHMGPFIMNAEGVGRIFAPLSVRRRTVPEFYEPTESPVANPLHPKRSKNPVVKKYSTPMDKYGTPERGSHRLHHLSADRALSLLDQEQSDERATGARAVRRNPRGTGRDLGIKGGDKVKVQRARQLSGQGDGHASHQAHDHRRQEGLSDRHPHSLRLPRHSGGCRKTARSLTNSLTPTVTDPNAHTPEFKGFW